MWVYDLYVHVCTPFDWVSYSVTTLPDVLLPQLLVDGAPVECVVGSKYGLVAHR